MIAGTALQVDLFTVHRILNIWHIAAKKTAARQERIVQVLLELK
jgi:hypothetical protein